MFKRLFKRLAQDEDVRRAEDLRAWAQAVPGVTLIADAQPRSVVRVAGVVDGVRVRPREGVQAFEALLSDGSGTLIAVWLGRRTIPGVTIGARLVIEGRLGGSGSKLQVMNPTYELAPQDH